MFFFIAFLTLLDDRLWFSCFSVANWDQPTLGTFWLEICVVE